jgi:hypothetical protein
VIAHHWNGNLYYWCEGCKECHGVPSQRWNWNGSLDRPTLSPSVRHYVTYTVGGAERTVCHYFIREGMIEYCGDCSHELKGQTRPLCEIPDGYGLPKGRGA